MRDTICWLTVPAIIINTFSSSISVKKSTHSSRFVKILISWTTLSSCIRAFWQSSLDWSIYKSNQIVTKFWAIRRLRWYCTYIWIVIFNNTLLESFLAHRTCKSMVCCQWCIYNLYELRSFYFKDRTALDVIFIYLFSLFVCGLCSI
jgi:hypothetical protein